MTAVHEPAQLQNGAAKRGRGRPRKEETEKPAASSAVEKSSGAKKPKVIVDLPEVVRIRPTSFERLIPALLDSVARVKNSGRLAVLVHTPTPSTDERGKPTSGPALAAEMGTCLDTAIIASGVPLEPFEIALINLVTATVVIAATLMTLPKDLTYEQGMLSGLLTGRVMRGEVVMENGGIREVKAPPQ